MQTRLTVAALAACLALPQGAFCESQETKKEPAQPFQVNEAKTLGLFPDALLAPANGLTGKRRADMEKEKAELNDLWVATINQSKDIQFVIERLQPTTDKKHESSAAVNYIAGALFDIGNTVPAMLEGPIIFKNSAAAGLNAMRKVVTSKTNAPSKPGVSVEQATLLYYVVRQTADKLVTCYRNYRFFGDRLASRQKTITRFQTLLNSLATDITPSNSLELRYLVLQSQADIDDLELQHELYRQQLVELAGAEAVDKLDRQLASATTSAVQ